MQKRQIYTYVFFFPLAYSSIPTPSCENIRSPTRTSPIFLNAPTRPTLLPLLIYTKINHFFDPLCRLGGNAQKPSSLSPLSVTREGTDVYLL